MNIRSAIYMATGLIVCAQTGKAEIMRVHNATGCSTTASTCGGETDWSDACCYLQDALGRCGGGDQIRVAEGVYYPDEGDGQTSGSRSATFTLPDACEVYGGYAGIDATDPDDRDLATYETILSGDLDDDDVSTSGPDLAKNTENSYHVVTIDDVDITSGETILDGFVVQRGNADGSQLNGDGAGILIHGCSPDIVNCLIRWNWAKIGGAIHVRGQDSDRGQVTLLSSDPDFPMLLTQNWVGIAGSAIYAQDCGTVVTLQGTDRDPPDEVISVEIKANRACGNSCGGIFGLATGAIYANTKACIVILQEENVDNCAKASGAGYYTSSGGKFNIEDVTYFEIDNNMTNSSGDCESGAVESNIFASVGCGCPTCP